MKKLILAVLLAVIPVSASAQFGRVSGCGTTEESIECSWFNIETGLPFGSQVQLTLMNGLQYPTGANGTYYIEGNITIGGWCPFEPVLYIVEVDFISICDECPRDNVGDLNSSGRIDNTEK